MIAIASLVDPILHATPLRPGGYGITRLWQSTVIQIEGLAFPNAAEEYVENRAFWSCLLAVAAHLDRMEAAPPEDDAWETVMGALWSPALEHRNAAGPTSRTLTAATFSDMWETLRAELARARGFDVRDDELGGKIEVPRTTNMEVRQLDAYWERPLVQLQVKVITGAVPSPEGFEDLQLEWQAVTQRVDRDAVHGKTAGVYPGNFEFWRTARALATALDQLQDRPAPYVVLEQAAAPSQPPTPNAPPAKATPTDLSSRLGDLADKALTALTHVVDDASNRLVATVGRPLLFTGATLAALLLIMRATAPCEHDHEATPERERGRAMSSRALPWVLAGGAAAIAAFVAIHRLRRGDAKKGRVDPKLELPSDAELRNAGLTYRPVGATGEPYPDWIRALDGQSGVYVIKEIKRDGSKQIVYVGESHSGRLYDTLTRHLQTVRHEA